MSESIKLTDESHRPMFLGRLSRMKLEGSFWTGLLVVGWEAMPFQSLFEVDAPPFAEWIALALAALAVFTAIQVKLRLRQRLAAEQAVKVLEAPNPLSLSELIRTHGVREFGSMYLYMPMPRRPRHDAAWAWIETLQAEQLIKGHPWPIKAERVKEHVRQNYGHLFSEDTEHFQVYRLDWQALHEFVAEEEVA